MHGRADISSWTAATSSSSMSCRGHSDFGGLAFAHLRGRRGAPVEVLATEEGDEFPESLATVAMLCQEVGRVFRTEHLAQVKAPCAHSLLDPQGVCVKVAKFA